VLRVSEIVEDQPENPFAEWVEYAKAYVAEHGPFPPPLPLRFENDPLFFNLFAGLPGTLQPGEPAEVVDYTQELEHAQGFSCELCSCLLIPGEDRRAELKPVIPLHGAEEAPNRLRFALAYAFTAWRREDVVATCPADLPHVRTVLEQLGFKLQFVREGCVNRGEATVGLEHYRITVDEWIPCNALLLERRETFDADWADPELPDALQNAYIGFVALCIDQQDAERGVEVYNRWARWVGLGFIQVKARAPAPSVQLGEASDARH
jgi:hypothetical protein